MNRYAVRQPKTARFGLFLFLLIFLSGFAALIALHLFFLHRADQLNDRVANQQARLSIGELMVNDLGRMEVDFQRITISTDVKSQGFFAEAVEERIALIRLMLGVLAHGGTVEHPIALNLPDRDEMLATLSYSPPPERYNLEIIELLPKLVDMEENIRTLMALTAERDRYGQGDDLAAWAQSIREIKNFLNKSMPEFTRMNEHAATLYFDSRLQLADLDLENQAIRRHYLRLEIILAAFVVGVVLALVALVARQLEKVRLCLAAKVEKLRSSRLELAEAHDRLSQVLDGLDVAVYVADIDSREILFINRHVRERHGEVLGQTCWQVFGGTNPGICDCCVNLVKEAAGEQPRRTWLCRRGDCWHEAHGQLISWRDRPQALLVIVIDVTERIRAEEERDVMTSRLHQSEKMEALGLLAGGVAHDLNNILSGLVTVPELLLFQLPADHPMRKAILEIKDSGKRAAGIADDLLTMTRGMGRRRERFDVNEVIRAYLCSPEFRVLLERHPGIAVEDGLGEAPALADGSAPQFGKVIMNLVGNAVEAIDLDGRVEISGGREQGADGEWLVFEVRDNGPGIPQEDQARIFEPFFSKKMLGRSGTGLGLAIVWNVVKDHGGAIVVQSDSSGTCFTIRLPAAVEG